MWASIVYSDYFCWLQDEKNQLLITNLWLKLVSGIYFSTFYSIHEAFVIRPQATVHNVHMNILLSSR